MGYPLRNPSLFALKFDSLPQFCFLKELKAFLNNWKSRALFIEFLFPHDIFLQGKILSHSPLSSTPPQNQKNPPENVCTLPNNHYCV